MLGDFAPFEELERLLRLYPRLNLYVDDAHAMSWTGRHGRGAALTRLGAFDRVFVAVSLSKAFGATGRSARSSHARAPRPRASMRRPTDVLRADRSSRARRRTGIGRVASQSRARRHAGRASRANARCEDRSQAVVEALRARGFFSCVSTFPAVPMNKPSIRFTVSRHNPIADVQAMVEALVEVSTSLSPSSFRRSAPPPALDEPEARLSVGT